MHRSIERTLRGVAVAVLATAALAPRVAAQGAVDVWEGLNDTTLVRLIDEALETNPTLAAAEARVRGARADRLGAALDLAPAVTAVGGYTRQRMSGATFPQPSGPIPDQDLWEAGLQMQWDLDVFGRDRKTFAARDELLDAAREDVRDVRVLLGTEVASSYFRLRGVQDRLAVARRNAENQRRTLTITEERLAAGRGTALDTERAKAQLSSTLSAIPTLEAAETAEHHRLSVLLGREPGVVVAAQGDGWAAPPLPAGAGLPDPGSRLLLRPDVAAAEQRLEATGDLVGAAKASYLPQISVRGAAGYTAGAFDALGNTGTPRYAIGPVLSWPFLDMGRVKSGVDRARADQAEAEARYEYTVLNARAEIATAEAEYARARERLTHLEAAAQASGRATELARVRFTEGAGDFLEVLDAERRLLEAEDRLSEGRTAATSALVALYGALGMDWQQRGGPG